MQDLKQLIGATGGPTRGAILRRAIRLAAQRNQPITLSAHGQQITLVPQIPSPRERVVRGFLSNGKFAAFMIDELSITS